MTAKLAHGVARKTNVGRLFGLDIKHSFCFVPCLLSVHPIVVAVNKQTAILDVTIRVSLLLSSLFSLPPFPFSFYSFRQHYENSAGVSATPMPRRFRMSRFESLEFLSHKWMWNYTFFLLTRRAKETPMSPHSNCRRNAPLASVVSAAATSHAHSLLLKM